MLVSSEDTFNQHRPSKPPDVSCPLYFPSFLHIRTPELSKVFHFEIWTNSADDTESLSPHYSSPPSSHDLSAARSFPVFSVFVFEGREESLVESGREALKRSSPGTWMSSGESRGGVQTERAERERASDWRRGRFLISEQGRLLWSSQRPRERLDRRPLLSMTTSCETQSPSACRRAPQTPPEERERNFIKT